jgi:uncharacterized protein
MTFLEAFVLFFAALVGGGLNSVAGGGSFILFPTLLAYQPRFPIESNATNTVALWPGSVASVAAYRRELEAQRSTLLLLGTVSLIGGLVGSYVLLHTRPSTFKALLPYLLLVATLLFTFGGKVTARLRRAAGPRTAPGWLSIAGVCALQLVISIYGGFFGGGIGILMLATLSLMGMTEMHAMNALKTVLASLINGVSVAMFVGAGKVLWPEAGSDDCGGGCGRVFRGVLCAKNEPRTCAGFCDCDWVCDDGVVLLEVRAVSGVRREA